MPIVVVGNERNFAALRPRLFAGRISTKAAGEVARAVREANPHADLDRLEPGTVLTVPDVRTVAVRGELSLDETTKDAVEGLSNAGKEALQALAAAGKARAAEARAERKQLAKSLEAKRLEDAVRKDKRLAGGLAAARKAVAEEEAHDKARETTLKQAQAEWTAGLDALKALLD